MSKSTSYERYWEGRKSFASMVAHVRNLSRMIWINVGLPPTDPQPASAKGKTPVTDLNHAQLRKRKIEAIRLALSFVFATKHYLRGEDGVKYADYHDVLPPSFARFDEIGYITQRTSHTGTYSAIKKDSGATTGDSTNAPPSGRTTPDATKRVRVKRSKQQLVDHSPPLLQDTHRTIEFHPFADEASLPLPLMSVI